MRYSNGYLSDLELAQKSAPNLEKLNHAKILITGAGGLIGSALADFLTVLNDTKNAGNTVFLGARSPDKLRARFGGRMDRDDMVYFPYDAEKPICTEVCFDYVIHAASPATPSAYVASPVETMLANFDGMKCILSYAKERGVRRVLYVSSSEVYGRKDGSKPYHEADYGFVDLLNPRACYPTAKRAAETLCAAYGKEYGVDTVIVRPGHVYGPTAQETDDRAASQFLRDAAQGHDIVMKSAGTQMRSYCYVADCASSVFAVLLNGVCGEAYNISNPNSIASIRQFAECAASCGGKRIVFSNPSDAEKSGYNLMDNSSLDSGKIEALGWYGQFGLNVGIWRSLEELGE